MAEQPPAAEFTEMETTREALRDAEARLNGLQNKMDTNMATDEEKEEFLELPNLIDRFRSELGNSSQSLMFSVEGEIEGLDKQIEELQDAGFARTKKYREIKMARSQKKRERLDLWRKQNTERARKMAADEVENVSELLGVSASEAKEEIKSRKERISASESLKFVGGVLR